MYKLILFVLLFLLLIITVAFLLARRESRKENLIYTNTRRVVGGLTRTITNKTPAEAIQESRELSGDMLKYKLLSSIEFLTDYSRYNSRILILDNENTKYLIFLRKLFPTHTYYVIGKHKLGSQLRDDDKIIRLNLSELPPFPYLLISFLPSSRENLNVIKGTINDKYISAASLRFKPGIVNTYFAGELYIPPYVTGMDVQLITRGSSMVTYNKENILSQLAFFNNLIKPYGYNEQAKEHIVENFAEKINHIWIKEKVLYKLNQFVFE